MNRRSVVVALGTTVASLAGCTSSGKRQPTESRKTTGKTTTNGTDGESSLTDWEATTDCEGEPNDMHDSVIKVARVESSIEDGHVPIHFSDLTTEEQAITRTVTETGGYGTCEVSDAFHRLVERASERTEG
ncbi:hypothetical protein [Halobacterium wangiae]|uniref:hypothetical protein n=1 Tax=Halobacterium wangiae TaxID=2902623 RepID=UPI001E30CE08|nr:hypothetical protein [Halobacterium wangiae]